MSDDTSAAPETAEVGAGDDAASPRGGTARPAETEVTTSARASSAGADEPAPREDEVVADRAPAAAEGPVVSSRVRSPVAHDRVRSLPVVVGLGTVAIALAVALGLSLSALGHEDALTGARTSALAAARTYAVELGGYDYRDLDRDFRVVLSHSTPSFRRSFTQSSDALKTTLSTYHAVAEATVVSAGLVSASTSGAVVLVLLEQRITNSTQTTPTTDRSQVEMTLVSSGGTWLIAKVNLL